MTSITSKLEWKIYNLKKIFKVAQFNNKTLLTSDRFSNSEFPEVEWELIIEINKKPKKKNKNDFVCIFLRQIGPNSINDLVNTKYRIYAIKNNKQIDIAKKSTNELESQNKMGYSKFCVFGGFTSNFKFLSPRPLYFCCEVEIAAKIVCYNPIENLQNNYFKMFKEELYTDFTFNFGENVIIKAHKSVLAQNSEYFRTLFGTNMIEAQRNESTIIDTSAICFKALMEFLYTGKITYYNKQMSENDVEGLYELADKYLVNLVVDESLFYKRDG